MYWFGEPWPTAELRAPVCEDDRFRRPVPLGALCIWCQELIDEGDSGEFYGDGSPVHKECGLRQAVGPMAFLEGRCRHAGGTDPCYDESISVREDALRVWAYFQRWDVR